MALATSGRRCCCSWGGWPAACSRGVITPPRRHPRSRISPLSRVRWQCDASSHADEHISVIVLPSATMLRQQGDLVGLLLHLLEVAPAVLVPAHRPSGPACRRRRRAAPGWGRGPPARASRSRPSSAAPAGGSGRSAAGSRRPSSAGSHQRLVLIVPIVSPCPARCAVPSEASCRCRVKLDLTSCPTRSFYLEGTFMERMFALSFALVLLAAVPMAAAEARSGR